MLTSLFIRNYVLIENLDIRFQTGLSVITGETGAGKSIILGALSLVLGQRADGKSIRQGSDKCVIEATFGISTYHLQSFFEKNDLEYDPESCILRRELYVTGKSRAFVNDSPVSLSVLKELGDYLIDIHSQHQNLLLGDTRFQLRVIDIMAKNQPVLLTYQKTYSRYRSIQKQIANVDEMARQKRQEEDYLRFQLEQLTEARLQPDELKELEEEQELLSHAEEIKGGLYRITDLLQGEEQSGVRLIKEALTLANALERYYPKAKEIGERLQSAYIDLCDLASDTDNDKEDIEFNPDRLDRVNERLNTLYSLQQKHRVSTVEELIELRETYSTQLKEIDSFDEQLEQLNRELEATRKELTKNAVQLREQRKKASVSFSAKLVEMIATLGIPHARLEVEMTVRPEPGTDGMDDIRFLFSAHRTGELQPVAQTASGGEISRLMLCIKTLIAGFTSLPAIIFDEVDTGVSGDIADKMGEIMQQLSKNMQVIAITHLPQIASKGTSHYFVYKEETPDSTATRIKQLDENERIREVARMLSGATLTEASLANAKELLK